MPCMGPELPDKEDVENICDYIWNELETEFSLLNMPIEKLPNYKHNYKARKQLRQRMYGLIYDVMKQELFEGF